MFPVIKFVFSIVILAGLLLPCSTANATVEVTTGFVSERKTAFISLHHEDVSPFPVLVAELAQSVNALDNAFHRLQHTGQLLPAYPSLVIEISDDAYQRLLPAGPKADGYALLSLENDYRLDLDPHDIATADALALGPVYSIELALWPVTYNELLTLVLLLPRLSVDNPRMELSAADIGRCRDEFAAAIERSFAEWSYNDLLWSPDGNLLLMSTWHNRRLYYQVFDFAAQERMHLEALDHYILPPTFSPDSRFVAYASQAELKIVDLEKHQTTGFSLREMAPDDYQLISLVQFAGSQAGDTLFFSLFGWGMPAPLTFLWHSAAPEQAELLNGIEFWEKPELPGVTWSDYLHRRHASIVKTPAEFVALKEEMAEAANVALTPADAQLQAMYGPIHEVKLNYPQKSRLAVLIEGEDRIEARALDLPSLQEIDTHLFNRVPAPQTIILGRLAGISLFNIMVIASILLIAAGITGLVIFVKRKLTGHTTASISRKKKCIIFAGALLITLLLHFVAAIWLVTFIDDDMVETATDIAYQAIIERYAEPGTQSNSKATR